MASEITRDGKTYKVAYTFKFDESGNIARFCGGEITDSDVDSIIEQDEADAKLDRQDKYFAMLEAEEKANQVTKTKSKSKSKSHKKGII